MGYLLLFQWIVFSFLFILLLKVIID